MRQNEPTIAMKLKPWLVPNFASMEMPARPRQEGMQESPSVPVAELPQEALDGLAERWLHDLYEKAGKPSPWSSEPSP